MVTKYITIPFDLRRAEKITSGVDPGKIVTRDGRDARIVCWDYQSMSNDYPILALIRQDNQERPIPYSLDGKYNIYSYKEENDYDLLLSVPEWTTFKDGDIVSFAFGAVSILKELGHRSHSSYFTLISDAGYFNNGNWTNENMRQASQDEKNNIISYLKSSDNPLAKEYLKRFFGIEEKKEFNFKPFDKVLVRDDDGVWFAGIFSHLRRDGQFFCAGGNLWEQCLPYNDQTKHLLGTTDAWEG